MIRNFASRIEKTSLKNDYVVTFFCGSRNRRLASVKNLLIILGREQTLKAQLMRRINFVAVIFFFRGGRTCSGSVKGKGKVRMGSFGPNTSQSQNEK